MTRETDHDARGRRKPGAYNSNSGPKRPPRSRGASTPSESAHAGERIAKVMARAGLCSRRDAELWVAEGRVAVNGTVLDSPARNVTEKDHITVDGKPLAQRERTRLFLFNKPRGLVTTDKDPEGRPTIFEALSADMPRVVSIGRLDINTEGLLLLTNDGGLARVLELPATGWLRRYRVRAYGETDQSVLDRLSEGVTIDGVDYRGIDAKIDRMQGDNVWITMGLREGKNREIKRVLEHIGLQVNRLIRISYGPFQLGELGEGAVEEIRTRILKDQLGENLAQEAGADFEAPIFSPDADRSHHYEGAKGRFADEEPAGPAEPHSPDRKRKHVSKLRDERATQSAKGARKRTTRDSTQDRQGRAVTVERVVAVERPRRGKDAPAASRNARRFAAAAGGDKPMRKRDTRPGEADAAPYVAGRGHGRSDMARGDRNEERSERPARSFDRPERSDARPARSFGARRDDARPASGERPRFEKRDGPRPERAPRGEGRPPRFSRDGDAPRAGGDRPFRSAASGERPRFEKRDGPRGERAPRGEGPRVFHDGEAPRPYRSAASDERPRFEKRDGPRPERAPRGEGRPPRFSRDGDAPRAGGDRPFRSAASGERPRFEKRDGPRPERAPRGEGRPPRFSRDGDAPRAGGDRPFRSAASGERPRFEKRDGPRPERAQRSERAPRGEGPSRFSRDGDRPRPAGKFGGKPGGGKPGGRPSGGRPGGDRPRGDRPGGDRPRGDRPGGGRSGGGKPGGRPSGGRPPRDKH
ncbi:MULTISPECIES: pseudouridine synthase [unclassified Beijerinckia]|uniref:pseudouridine synthase n=1 Tax=unclassified Beijerinckia TaxID=2638183 RepID=UPI00089BCBCF|nr:MULTISPECIES: pseudouridine synthase [unclassified Beijerinckia]MDH7797172.1 23S rRNA pseudouridine2605 synthase [Beijerinckia sp. GAS462]SEC75015.1 23S rRNA pseudouridine2605 synthase [Beijerinckia sp. 28-YEA-48]